MQMNKVRSVDPTKFQASVSYAKQRSRVTIHKITLMWPQPWSMQWWLAYSLFFYSYAYSAKNKFCVRSIPQRSSKQCEFPFPFKPAYDINQYDMGAVLKRAHCVKILANLTEK